MGAATGKGRAKSIRAAIKGRTAAASKGRRKAAGAVKGETGVGRRARGTGRRPGAKGKASRRPPTLQKTPRKPRKTMVRADSGERLKNARGTVFLQRIADGLTVAAAARKARVGRTTVYEWLEGDAEFKERFDAAWDEGREVLVEEVRRRGVDGVRRPVFQGGSLVGHVQEYSDSLLMFLVKQRDPSFRESQNLNLSGSMDVNHHLSETVTRMRLAPAERVGQLAQRILAHDHDGIPTSGGDPSAN